MQILVIASTPVFMFPSPKNLDYINTLKKANLRIPTSDIEKETLYMNAAKGYAKRARDLFRGSFRRIVKGVEDARSVGIKADLFLISPRYGVITENNLLLPYTFTLTRKSKGFLRALSERLRTKELVSDLLMVRYDLCIIIANRNDLLLLHDPRKGFDLSKKCKKLVVLSAPSMAKDFSDRVEFFGITRVRERADYFAKFIDKMTTRTLKDYVQ